jgi:hypothetical protein
MIAWLNLKTKMQLHKVHKAHEEMHFGFLCVPSWLLRASV